MNKKLLITLGIVLSVLVIGFFAFRLVINNLVGNQVPKAVLEASLSEIRGKFEAVHYNNSNEIDVSFSTANPKIVSLSLNQGRISVDSSETSNITGQVAYDGQNPSVEVIEADGYEIFKVQHLDQEYQFEKILLPTGQEIEVMNIGVGLGIVNLLMADLNVKEVNLGVGAGEILIRVPYDYDSKINLGSGSADTTISVDYAVGFKVIPAEGHALENVTIEEGVGYKDVDGAYVSDKYDSSFVKTEIIVGQNGPVSIVVL